ncbi:MAG: Fe-S cluster domain-containing protein [Paludibacter sp.]|jgi:electron transport complex protein RnfB|nr:Fe-S cluster domain-containing protein [Paludibacter sp.]HOS46332.1 Fe-S cluster domain-containing protein [Paludibacter sp.]
MNLIWISLITLGVIGSVSAIILYVVAKKFHVEEDHRIDLVEEVLPAANCGGCGYPGCRNFADACVKADDLSDLYCPVGGNETMAKVADILGLVAVEKEPMVAVVRCNGTCEHRPRNNEYDGVKHCFIAHNLYSGETNCSWGCLGFGDCELACDFDAIHVNPITKIPEVIDDKCTACGACMRACPKDLIELRKMGPKGRRVYVDCRNQDRGHIVSKACEVGCIGCAKCQKVCKHDAITIENNLAFIHDDKCKLCRDCVIVCPTNSIIDVNFPRPKQPKVAVEEEVSQ